MALLKPIKNGRMYEGWYRWNPIPGCLHDCSYCYMKAMGKRTGKDMMTPTGLREEYLKDNLGSGRKIFVCSSGDMWGEWVGWKDIAGVLDKCAAHENEYMFLTKNPDRYLRWTYSLCGLNCVLGVTIESDILTHKVGVAPDALSRLERLRTLRAMHSSDQEIMISIEPVMKFSPKFATYLKAVNPNIVYIGRDTGHNDLPEPTDDELRGLVTELRDAGITVHLKKSLNGLMEG